MTQKIIKNLRKQFNKLSIDGYIIPKNDEFFSEYSKINRLKTISNFSGSAGYAVILKKKNYLFVDGRYTLQANNQSGKSFKIITIPDKLPNDILQGKEMSIGFDPNLFTKKTLLLFFGKNKCIFKPLGNNLIDKIWKRKKINIKKKFFI